MEHNELKEHLVVETAEKRTVDLGVVKILQ